TLDKENGEISVKKQFSLYKVIEENGELYTADTFDLYQKTKDEELRKDILFFVNRFVNSEKFTEVQEIYDL
ncbi:MAG: hypothetical protein J6V70_08415, partial [Kiritimatiellae bacterium]|nr:hypothetical protein [Kiritimatiellia bacterium]